MKTQIVNIFKSLVVKILRLQSKSILNKYKPTVIGITGNIGKTSAKDYIYHVLKEGKLDVRANKKSFNSEIGTPLTIIGSDNPWSNMFSWSKVFCYGLRQILTKVNYPKILVLEIGADRKGDIQMVSSYIKPKMVVLTAFQDSPTHGEYFKTKEEFVREKQYLVDALEVGGMLIYNKDDVDMCKISETRNDVNKMSYSKDDKSDMQIMQTENNFIYSDDLKIKGLEFILKLKSKKTSLSEDVKLYDVLGDGHVYSLAAAVCVGLYFDLKFTEIIKSFKNIEFPNSRMRILKGINDSVLIDDSYNASPKAVTMAINTLNKIVNKGKKIIVLGHMAELSEDVREEEHLKMAELAVRFADIVCFVGYNNELFKLGVKNDDGKAKFFKKSEEALEYLKDKVEGDDIVLVKGSQSARCEKVVVGLLKNYGDRYEVCRQEKEWSQR